MGSVSDKAKAVSSAMICDGGDFNKVDIRTATVAEIKSSGLQYCFIEGAEMTMNADIKQLFLSSGVKILALAKFFEYLVSK